jgi:hypothetical protein
MTRGSRIALLLAALAVVIAAVVVIGLGGDDDGGDPAPAATTTGPATTPTRPSTPPVPEIRLRGGEPAGGVRTLEFEAGERARFAVASDRRAEIHVHGYDVTRSVPPGGRVTISFRARAQGVFEIESHTTHREIARLRVVP